jgi:predicted ATPase
MVERVTGGKALPPEVVQQIVAKTDGVPLFIEELTKTVLESGLYVGARGQWKGQAEGAPLPPLAIPATLQDALMARLDRLSTVREIAQLGATLGREFSYELLQAVSPLDEERLQQGLKQLVEAELVYQRGLLPQAHYLFKHALIQDTAYQSLLKSTRQQYHRQIAQVLEGRFPETVETQPELLAHHYTEAGLVPQAVPYWQRAGQRAVERSANVEAASHLTKGLELLKTLPNTPEHGRQELGLQTTLGPALMAVKGFAASEVETAYTRALELCRQVGDTPQLFTVLRGLWGFYFVRAELQTAHELGEQCLTLAQRAQSPALLLWAHYALGTTLFALGEFAPARAHLEQGIGLYDPQKRRSQRALQDPGVACLAYMALVLWFLGYPDQALKRIHEALTLAQKLSHPFTLAFALNAAAWLHQLRREGRTAQERAEVETSLSREQGFAFFLGFGTIFHGWALIEQGQREEGIAQIGQGLAACRGAGGESGRPHFLALLAEGHAKAGQAEEGLTVLAEGLAPGEKNEDRYYRAELYRLKGVLTLQQAGTVGGAHPTAEAEAYFHQALDIARKQQAKSLELRAVMSLSRLWQRQGKKNEARQMLAEIYGWFTEGFDIKDLQEAKALLEELA